MKRVFAVAALVVVAVGVSAQAPSVSPAGAGYKAPPPRFTDPDRRAKLEKAFPAIAPWGETARARSLLEGAGTSSR